MSDPIADALYPPRPHRSEPRKTGPPSTPEIQRDGDEFTFLWHDHGIGIGFTQLREGSDGIHGEITVHASGLGSLHWGRLNLASTSAREGLVKKLHEVHPIDLWRAFLETACRTVAERLRQGQPIVSLEPVAAPTTRQLIERLLPLGETSVIFGDGGTGKSLLALSVTVAVSSGIPLPGGLRPTQEAAPVLLLDWESCQEEQNERLAGLLSGFGLSAAPGIYYRPMARGLADDAAYLRAEISRLKIGLVIVDSLGPACGAEPESADSAIRVMNALRSFVPATRLVIAHVSKASADQRSGSARPFGSVYVQNLARSVWEMRRAQDDGGDDLAVGLFHRKVNRGRLHSPIGLRFEFGRGVIRVVPSDIGEQPELLARTSLSYRIQRALAAGMRTTAELSEELEAPEVSVRKTCYRLQQNLVIVRLGGAQGGRGKEAQWGLPAKPDQKT